MNSLAWLANKLNERGMSLKKGQIIMTGSMVPTQWLKKKDTITSIEYEKGNEIIVVVSAMSLKLWFFS